MDMFSQIYGKAKSADQPGPNRAERRARARQKRSQQRRAQKAWDRKVATEQKENPP